LSIGDEQEEEAGAEQKGKKSTKAQKRREKQAAKQAERDARIAAELEAAGPSAREEEEAALKALLAPLGLGIKEIRVSPHSDGLGHCMRVGCRCCCRCCRCCCCERWRGTARSSHHSLCTHARCAAVAASATACTAHPCCVSTHILLLPF
jgi:hypothetical protein